MRFRLNFMVASLALLGGLLLSAGAAPADTLTNSSVNVAVLDPNMSTILGTGTVAVGVTQTCPGSSTLSAICSQFGGGTESITVGTNSITLAYMGSATFGSGAFNGFEFSGLTFASGIPLNGFTLGTNTISGFTSSDVTSSGSTVFINLAGLPAMGTVVVDLTTGSSTSVPEPSSLAMLAVGLLGIGVFGLARRRVHSDLLS